MIHALRMQAKSHRSKKILIHLRIYTCIPHIHQLHSNQVLQMNKNTPNLVEFNIRWHATDMARDYK